MEGGGERERDRQTERETETDRQTQTDRQTDKETERDRERQRQRQRERERTVWTKMSGNDTLASSLTPARMWMPGVRSQARVNESRDGTA